MSPLLLLLIYTVHTTTAYTNVSFSTSHYESTVFENQPVGTSVLQLQLILHNTSLPNLISLSLQGHLHYHFWLDSDSTIYTAVVLDRETTPFYELTVLALSNNSRTVAISNISISIRDLNDNRPYCLDTFYPLEVNESSVSDAIMEIQCGDVDEGDNAILRYQLQNGHSAFSLTTAGTLSLSQTLDYEQRPDTLLLEILVSDLGEPSLSTLISILVSILPVNEFPPQFTNSPLSTSISENTKPENKIAQLTASDMDSGRDGDIYYYLTSSEEEGLFHVDLYSGSLYLLKSLDREKTSLYTLQITASNSPVQGAHGDLNSSVLLQLTVLDVPEDLHFEASVYFSTVPENINTVQEISRVSCDTSSNPNPPITYFISSPSPFHIDSNSGSVTAQSTLDYESTPSFELTVSCTCCSYPTPQHATLFISISDINEFPPVFSSPSYSISVREDTPLGTELLHVNAVDRDSGYYGDVVYTLLNHLQLFYLHHDTGVLYLRGSLNYRADRSYNLTLFSTNRHSDIFNDTATVHVTVTEYIADRPPDCIRELITITLDETSPILRPLAQFSCESSNPLNFSFHDSLYLPFSLSENGTLSLQSSLDYESGDTQYFLEIRATRYDSPLYTPVLAQVIVAPVNEYPPLFSQPLYSLSLSELAQVGTSVMNVTATDADVAPDGGVMYEISAEYNTFSIDPLSGSIYLISSLDYDITSQYNISITASDLSSHPLTGSATLQIQIINENTAPPRCNPRYLAIFINESSPIDSVVATYSCYDPDAILLSSEITRSLTPPLDQFLSPINDSLLLTAPLDYETATGYNGILVASELNSTFSTLITISIFVDPTNEFYPHFTNLPYALTIDIQTLLSSPIFSVRAVDRDSGRDGEVSYFLNMTGFASIFHVDSYTGDIWLRYPINRIPYTTVEISIGVKDHSLSSQLANYSTISVSILHEANYTCEHYFYSISTPEDTNINSTLFNISCASATDYVLKGTDVFSSAFSVTSQGQIVVSAPLDAETTDIYESTLTVVFPRNTTLTVGISISVEDVNEFPPSFTLSPPHLRLYSDTELGALLTTLLAEDSDSVYNRVSYSLGNTMSGLYLSRHTGELFLSSKHVFSLQSPLYVLVTAQDNDPNHQLSANTELRIELFNVSSSDPEPNHIYPLEPVFVFSVWENQEVGSLIGNVSCAGSSHTILYSLLTGNYNQTFSMDMRSGQLVLDRSLDYEKTVSFTLLQSCTSSENANISSEFLTIVKVLDVNEYAPVVENSNHTIYLYENYTVGEKIHSLVGFDPDNLSNSISYRIIHTEPNNSPFIVSRRSGDIYLVGKLDYEEQTHYTMCIYGYDGDPAEVGTRSSQVVITIRVLDINDNIPLCPSVLALHVTPQSNRSRLLVASLNCSDMDSQQITQLRYYEEETFSREYFELIPQGYPITWQLYFLSEEARASHNGSLLNVYFHYIVCCDGSTPELCTDLFVLVTTVEKPALQSVLNATQLALAIKSEGLENLITLFFNISRRYWDEVVDHFKFITAHVITTYCIGHPRECSIAQNCASYSETEWFGADSVVIQDVHPVSTEVGAQLEVQFYVSLPDIPKDSDAVTAYVVPGGVLLDLVGSRSDLLNNILTPSPSTPQCTNPFSELVPYLLTAFVLGILFALALFVLAFLSCKLCKCWKLKSQIVISKKKIFPDETERIRVSSIEDDMELREISDSSMRQNEGNLYTNTITPLSSMSTSRDKGAMVSKGNKSVELEESGRKEAQETKNNDKSVAEDSNTMNPFWKTNPRFWRIQDKKIETEYCISPHLAVEPCTSMKDTDSHITEYYSSTDLSVFTSQTGLSQASMKALGKARGRYDLMELASMESEALPTNTDKSNTRSRPESQNLRSQATSRSTTLYLPSSSSTASNTSIQELPKSSTAANIQIQKQGEVNLVPKKAWVQD